MQTGMQTEADSVHTCSREQILPQAGGLLGQTDEHTRVCDPCRARRIINRLEEEHFKQTWWVMDLCTQFTLLLYITCYSHVLYNILTPIIQEQSHPSTHEGSQGLGGDKQEKLRLQPAHCLHFALNYYVCSLPLNIAQSTRCPPSLQRLLLKAN